MVTQKIKPEDKKEALVIDKAGPVIGVARQIALSVAAMSIALAALCLALLSFAGTQRGRMIHSSTKLFQ